MLPLGFQILWQGRMVPQKQVEEAIIPGNMSENDDNDNEREGEISSLSLKSLLWHGGSVYDAWFSCASNQVIYKHLETGKI